MPHKTAKIAACSIAIASNNSIIKSCRSFPAARGTATTTEPLFVALRHERLAPNFHLLRELRLFIIISNNFSKEPPDRRNVGGATITLVYRERSLRSKPISYCRCLFSSFVNSFYFSLD